jgi:hypothetical protein
LAVDFFERLILGEAVGWCGYRQTEPKTKSQKWNFQRLIIVIGNVKMASLPIKHAIILLPGQHILLLSF